MLKSTSFFNSLGLPAKYGAAFIFTLLALLFTYFGWSILESAPFLLAVAAVSLSAWLGGFGPGIFSAVLSIVGLHFLLLEPEQPTLISLVEVITSVLFAFLAFLISWLSGRQNQAQHQLEERTEELEERKGELEKSLIERTNLMLIIERERRESKLILNTLPGIVYEGVGSEDAGEQNMRFISDYSMDLLGYPPESWYEDGDFWEKILHPDDWRAAVDAANRSYEVQQAAAVRFRCYNSDGELLYLESHNAAINDEDGNRLRQCGMVMDVTDRVKFQEERDKLARQLERSNKELEQFAYVASHDLQEPLRMVNSYLQLLEKRYADQLDDDAKEFIGYAVDGASRMKDLISDLLAFSRVHKNEPIKDEVDMNSVVKTVTNNLAISIEETGAKIEVGDLPTIIGDEIQLVQLVQNLISNAIKFKTDGEPVVRIDAQKSGRYWQFTVADNGIGIAPQFQERIFNIFQRLHTRDEYPGTGIGLAICQKIVGRHGGEISVESDGKNGTAFEFTVENF